MLVLSIPFQHTEKKMQYPCHNTKVATEKKCFNLENCSSVKTYSEVHLVSE
jgi:hypothetical protein